METGFIIKKLIGMAAMPIPLTLLCILLGFIWLKRSPVKARFVLLAGFLILGLSSWNPVADDLIRPHEHYYPIFDTTQKVDAVVVLGSASKSAPPDSPAIMSLGPSAVYRLMEGLRILNENPDAILIVTGYAGFSSTEPHAELLKNAAIEQGVDPLRIYAFPTAQDTEAEAQLTKSLLQNKRFALVTEASHLKRAMTFFEQAELSPYPAPAKYTGAWQSDPKLDATGLYKTERALYEFMGRAWQWLKSLI